LVSFKQKNERADSYIQQFIKIINKLIKGGFQDVPDCKSAAKTNCIPERIPKGIKGNQTPLAVIPYYAAAPADYFGFPLWPNGGLADCI
jgi:hypothetical protein